MTTNTPLHGRSHVMDVALHSLVPVVVVLLGRNYRFLWKFFQRVEQGSLQSQRPVQKFIDQLVNRSLVGFFDIFLKYVIPYITVSVSIGLKALPSYFIVNRIFVLSSEV